MFHVILFEPENDDEEGWANAKASSKRIIEKIGNDPRAFAKAARTLSKCNSAQQDGALGQIRRGELVESIQSGLEALKDGETGAEPVRSRFGWHVLRLHRRIPGQVLPFEVVRSKIADTLEARSWTVESARYISDLATAGNVEGVLITGISN